MDAILGMELPLIVKFVVSFAIVLLLIGAAALLVRKFGGKALIRGGQPRGQKPRLAVVDTAPVDARRNLVIVRRDNVEHLLLIGGPTDVLVESNITTAVAVQPARELAAELRTPTVEPEVAVKPAKATPSVALAAPVVAPSVEAPLARAEASPAPARVDPTVAPETRPEPRFEPALMPEPWREPEVREPPIPVFAPPPSVAARIETPAPEVFVEPRQPQTPAADLAPPVVVPPLPATATTSPDLNEPLARFAQDLNAHRDHMNGQRLPPAHIPPSISTATVPTPRPVGPSASDEQSLADMAQRLEAALRRPLGANGTRAAPQPPASSAPRVSATVSVRQGEPQRRAPTITPPVPPQPAAARPVPPGTPVPPQISADEAVTNLQREMASLLGRKPGSS